MQELSDESDRKIPIRVALGSIYFLFMG